MTLPQQPNSFTIPAKTGNFKKKHSRQKKAKNALPAGGIIKILSGKTIAPKCNILRGSASYQAQFGLRSQLYCRYRNTFRWANFAKRDSCYEYVTL